ncbi:two pore domain potassium channel family protein [Streptomyces triculaminicus]|uniref:Two pore domain potassium channel family protein n=2 Tax=Streptomyces TaxID=1883 RepID=A0A939FPV1_9ACTN|nr:MULTISPECIES: potassium channel family protein [Streptomyces]MBO0655955.1 two pore domain potassium channel family protein [Streptomyces triculaminicus]QSY49952.1 two pore domain potassium channel family protein [Streptomyces griseocarneus]
MSVALRPVGTATALVLAYYLLPLEKRFEGGTAVGLVLGLAAVAALFTWQIRSIMRSSRPRLRAVEALATTVPLFLLIFAAAYYLVEQADQGSFTEPLTRTDALYFALTVFSTVGFGDIAPHTEEARIATMAQMAGDILLVGVAAHVVVGAVQSALARDPSTAPRGPRGSGRAGRG